MTTTFSESDYKSNDGMLTYVWGPPLWHFLHTMSFNYPVNPTIDDKNRYEAFIHTLGFVLPCRYCRDNYYNNLRSINFSDKDFKNRDTFSRMIYNLHDAVNKQLNKTTPISYDEVKHRYEHFRARCNLKTYEQQTKNLKEKPEKGCTDPEKGLMKVCSKILVVPYKKNSSSNTESIKIADECKIKN